MRWDGQRLTAATPGALPGLESVGAARVVRTPEFAGITFHEVLARSALNYGDLYGDGAHPRPPYADRVAARLEAALAGVRLETATPGPVVRGRVAAAPVAETLDNTLF